MCFAGLQGALMGGDAAAAPAGLTDQWADLAANPPMPPPRPGSVVTPPPAAPAAAPAAPGAGAKLMDMIGSGLGQMVPRQQRPPEEREPPRMTGDVGPMGDPLRSAPMRPMFPTGGEGGLADVVVPQIESGFVAAQAQRPQPNSRVQNPTGNLRRS